MTRPKPFKDLVQEGIHKGVGEGVFPGAVLLVSHEGRIIFHEGAGHTSLEKDSRPIKKNTIFDLASLTKPLATSLSFMKLVDTGRIGLDQSLAELIKDRPLMEKAGITPRLLLCHASGFEAWRPFYLELEQVEPHARKKALRDKLLSLPLAYKPGERSLYSDLGFMMLEWLLEISSGLSLKEYTRQYIYKTLALDLFFAKRGKPVPFKKETIAATEVCSRRNQLMQGEVHDDNAYVLGGYSGHAGLFGNAGDIWRLVSCLLQHYYGQRSDLFSPETVRAFFTRQDIKEGTWALGWDTPSQANSSSGRYFSPKSVGHLGFTGTSVWADLEKDIIVILLTNRVHPDRDNIKIRDFRPRIHDLIMKAMMP